MKPILQIILLAGAISAVAPAAYAAAAKPATPGVVVDTSTPWNDTFIGGYVGYGSGLADETGGPFIFYPAGGVDIGLSGAVIGATAGKNFSMGNGVVLGVVTDFSFSNMGGTYEVGGVPNFFYDGTTQHVNWTGDLRGRIGFAAGKFLPYLTGGIAVANSTRHSNFGVTAMETQAGLTAGAGVEFMMTDHASVNVQYLYSDYGTSTFKWTTGPFNDPSIHTTTSTITTGVNWGF